jgi:hypothetical protein
VLFTVGRGQEAYQYCKRSLELAPNVSDSHLNMGLCQVDLGQVDAAITSFKRALELNPDNVNAHDALGLSLLLSGDLQAGWREQEWRWRKRDFESRRTYGRPAWDGSSLAARAILLTVEQGYGDIFQFCRYVPLLAERGAQVYLETTADIADLLSGLAGLAGLVVVGEPSPPFDVQCPLMSVPLLYGTTLESVPAKVPYLSPRPQLATEWSRYFENDRGFKVGIAWAGRPTHANDFNRSATLAAFAPLAEVANISLYSLQKGDAAGQIAGAPAGMKIVDLSSRLTDFNQTAAAIAGLDLVIAVDTAIVHLAGAMAKPVWTLLPFCPDWRWLLNRSDSPWYPTMRLFRCPRPGDRASAIANVKEALTAMAVTRPGS